MDRYEKIGLAIRRAREAKDLSQRSLAKLARTTSNTVSEIERGREPSFAVLMRLCDALGVEIVALLTDAFGPSTEGHPSRVREAAPAYGPDMSDAIALKLAETNHNITRWSELLGYMRAVHDMMKSVTASQGKVIEQTEPLVQLQQEIAGRHLPDDLQRQIREHLVQSAQAEKPPGDRKAQ